MHEECCNGHHKKYIAPIMAVVLVILGIYLVSLTRNSIESNNYIGKSPEFQERITITGEGKVNISPDIATISIGVVTEKTTVASAQSENTTKMNGIIDSLKNEFEIKSDDLQTSQYRINPRYQYDDGRRSIVGYEVTQSLTVKVRDFDKIGNVISKAGDLGANSVNGPNFIVDDPEAYKAEAREKAIASAKEKAETLADQVGVSLGPIIGFNENIGGSVPRPYYDTAIESFGMGGDLKAAPQIEAGTEEISVSVSISYEIR